MSPSHSDRRTRGGLGSMLLAGACCCGAAAYAVFVGPSMLPPQAVETANAAGPEVLGSITEPSDEEVEPVGPVGRLRVQVTDRHRAWVQNLECVGDLEEDPAPCRAMAEVAADMADEPTASEGAPETEGEEGALGAEIVFTEIRDGTVCTDKVYGPQQAVIMGTWEGQEIDTSLTRRGSCEEARWQRLAPLTERFTQQ